MIFLLARNDLRLTLRDRSSLFFLLLLPVAFTWFFGAVSSRGTTDGPPRIALDVVDEDVGWLSRAFVGELQSEGVSLREIQPEDEESTANRVRTLRIPVGFTERVLDGEQQVLRLEKEPGSSEEFGLAAQVHITRAIVRTVSRLVEMEELTTGGSPVREEVALEEFRRLSDRADLVRLEVSVAGAGREVPSGFAQSVPGMLTMMVLMMTLIYGAVYLSVERRSGMLRRLAGTPITRTQIYLGKVLGRILIAGLQIAVLLLAGTFLFGISWGRSPVGLILVLVAYAGSVAGLSTLLGAVVRTPEQASGLGWLLSMVLAALGGTWWPSEVMPRWMWRAAHALPTAWAMDAFHALISFGRGLEAVLLPSGVLLLFGLVFALLGARFLRYDP